MGFLPNLLVKIIVRTDSKQAATIFFFLGCPVKQAWPSNCLPKVAQITKHMCYVKKLSEYVDGLQLIRMTFDVCNMCVRLV